MVKRTGDKYFINHHYHRHHCTTTITTARSRSSLEWIQTIYLSTLQVFFGFLQSIFLLQYNNTIDWDNNDNLGNSFRIQRDIYVLEIVCYYILTCLAWGPNAWSKVNFLVCIDWCERTTTSRSFSTSTTPRDLMSRSRWFRGLWKLQNEYN